MATRGTTSIHWADEPGDALPSTVVQVLSSQGGVAGAGFLASQDVVITCAHVVALAGHGPEAVVSLRFSSAPGTPEIRGWIDPNAWRSSEAEDVAVIRLDATPAGAEPLPLGSAVGCRGHGVRSFGFPQQARFGGHFGYGVVGGLLPASESAGALLQLTAANDLTQGFSGGPVLDEVTGLVIGMVSAITSPDPHLRGQHIAYATPTQVLREICHGLTEEQVCPYRGLEPFTTEHAGWFHGRDAAQRAVLDMLKGQRRVSMLLGPSGSGKSSLIQAGVLPALTKGGVPGGDRWLNLFVARPGPDLLAALERQGLPGAVTGLDAAVRRRLADEPRCERLLLVVDQFEELLPHMTGPQPTLRRTEENTERAWASIKQLTLLTRSQAPVSVILVMRNDFYAQLADQAPALLDAVTPLLNIRASLTREDLESIIISPAATVGLRFETGLSKRIMSDVVAATGPAILEPRTGAIPQERDSEPGTAPATLLTALELTLLQLWERRNDGCLTHNAYESIGTVTGALTTWCRAAFDRLPEDQHATARRILTALVDPGDPIQGAPSVRRQMNFSTLYSLVADPQFPLSDASARDSIDTALSALVRHRIVTTRARENGSDHPMPVVELIHDSLIRDWHELQEWVAQDNDFYTWLHRTEGQQARWANKKRPGDLLHGTDLAAGIEWSRRRGLPRHIAQFLHMSHRRAKRRIQILAATLALALVAAGLAFWQRQSAVESEHRAITTQRQALSRQLATQSEAIIGTDPDLASLLAVHAYQTSHTAEATASLYNAAELPLRARLTGHTDEVSAVAFSLDGTMLATGSKDGTVRLWDTVTRRPRLVVKAKADVQTVAFSPDGKTIATGGWDGRIRTWSTTTGHLQTTMTSNTDLVLSVAFSPDGKTLAATDTDATTREDIVALWDPVTGRRNSLSGQGDQVESVAFSPDGTTLAVGQDETVRLWDTGTGRVRTTLTSLGSSTLAFSPSGKSLAAAGDFDGKVQVWDAADGRLQKTLSSGSLTVEAIAFSPDGATLAAGGGDMSVRLWDIKTGRTRTTLIGHTDTVNGIAFSPDGKTVATGSSDRTIRIWRTPREPVKTVVGQAAHASAAAFSPDGRTLAIGQEDGSTWLWDVKSGRVSKMLTGHTADVTSVAFSPDGKTVATGSNDMTVRLWDAGTGRALSVLSPQNDPVKGGFFAVAFSPDGKRLAVGDGYRVWLWELATQHVRKKVLIGPTDLMFVTFSPDGTTLAIGGSKTVRLWDTTDGRIRSTISVHPELVSSTAFSPSGRTLAIASSEALRLRDLATGHTRTIRGGVSTVAYSPDGRTLATGSEAVQLRDAATGRILTTVMSRAEYPLEITFQRDGRALHIVSERAMYRWNMDLPRPGGSIERICAAVGRGFTANEKGGYAADKGASQVCPQGAPSRK
ncbi:nSTAND1 domain-containing NTPase [Streptomyces sp. NPDC055239]